MGARQLPSGPPSARWRRGLLPAAAEITFEQLLPTARLRNISVALGLAQFCTPPRAQPGCCLTRLLVSRSRACIHPESHRLPPRPPAYSLAPRASPDHTSFRGQCAASSVLSHPAGTTIPRVLHMIWIGPLAPPASIRSWTKHYVRQHPSWASGAEWGRRWSGRVSARFGARSNRVGVLGMQSVRLWRDADIAGLGLLNEKACGAVFMQRECVVVLSLSCVFHA